MSVVHWHDCDGCGEINTTHPDDGPPTGWWLVAHMNQPGCWDDDWHFCSARCLNEFTWGDE